MDDPEKLRRLMAAVLMITADVELSDLLRDLVREARSLVGARYAALGVLNSTRTALEQFLTAGLTEEEEARIGARPTGRGVLGLLITEPAPLRITNLEDDPNRYGFPPNHPPMTTFLGVPIRVRGEVYGNLYLTDKDGDAVSSDTDGGAAFTDEDEALAEAFALAAGIAIENHRLHEQVRVMSVLEDRDRIARDLHDRVIQRVYAVGMSLDSATRLSDTRQVTERITRAVDELDATITEIRSAIFELSQSSVPGGLRRSVLHLADTLAETLGVRPEVRFSGAVDNDVPQPIGDHVLAVVREGLTNAGKHAGARHLVVQVGVTDRVTVEVIDDGTGIELPLPGSSGLGLVNLRERAKKLGGTFEIFPGPDTGTRLVWSVPLARRDAPAS